MKIVSADKVYLYPEHIKKLKAFGEVTIYNDVPEEAEYIRRIKDADIVINNWVDMPAAVISAAPNLKMICIAATGYEWVDLQQAKKQGITVCNAPAYSTEAVAEHTIGLMLAATRLTSSAEYNIRRGKWDPLAYKGKELKGKTLGVIGYGSIGRRISEIAKNGFGMNILYVNSSSSRKDFEQLLKKSDVITINAPLTDKTKGMIGSNEFELMNSGVIIINTGRGAIIDENAFISALKSGKIFAAGLDVLTIEPMKNTDPLFAFPNVTITPHIAFNTEESEFRLSQLVTENIKKFLEGTPQNVIS